MKTGSKAHKKRRKSKIAWRMQAVISTISVSLLLVLMGLVVLFSLTARVVADSVKENLTVTVVFGDDVQTKDAVHMLDSLKEERYVSDISYISREQALQEQVESMGLDPTEFLGTNPFSISMEVRVKPEYSSGDSLQWISEELRGSDLVAEVMYQKDLVESLNKNLHRASYFLLAVALLLVIISLSLINNTVRLSVFTHRFVMHTMKLVGAKWSFIRRPFLVRAFWIGVVSAIIADAAIFGGIYWASRYDNSVFDYVTQQNMIITGISVLVIGLLLTIICTYFSVTHCLKMRGSELY
jgi:cell division transport system permease protein